VPLGFFGRVPTFTAMPVSPTVAMGSQTGTFSQGGFSIAGAGAPTAPTSISAVPDTIVGNGADFFFIGPDVTGTITPITQVDIALFNSPSGTSAGLSYQGKVNATTGMMSMYGRVDSIPAGSYTAQIRLTNSNGQGPAGTSSAFTISNGSDYYVSQGAASSTATPQNTAWSTYGGSGTQSYADTTRVFPGQTNAMSLATGGLMLPFYKSPWCSAGVNGNFYTANFTNFTMLLYGTVFSGEVNMSFRWCSHGFSNTTTGGSNTFTDNSQNLVTNGLVNGAGSIQWRNTGSAQNAGAGCSNTAHTVTNTNGGGHTSATGDPWIASYGDQDFTSGSTNSQPVVGGLSSYVVAQFDPTTGSQVSTLTSFQANVWNKVVCPLSVMNLNSGFAGNYKEMGYTGAIQEFRLQNLSGATIYVTNFGFLR
jgi:hypothetical protein